MVAASGSLLHWTLLWCAHSGPPFLKNWPSTSLSPLVLRHPNPSSHNRMKHHQIAIRSGQSVSTQDLISRVASNECRRPKSETTPDLVSGDLVVAAS
ncbi:hypothetical protein EDB85DRAFT_1917319, partial [Lactarius pseudohatsudake]